MALRYGINNAVDFDSSKIMMFASIYSRTMGQPMDKTQLWYPLDGKTGYERACEYAATASAYVGQELAVVDVVYEEDGTTVKSTSVKFYGIQDSEGTLKEVGAIPVGDEATIAVDDEGKISLKGIDTLVFERDVIGEDDQPTGAKEEVKYQALLTKDGLTWVEPSKTTVEGLATLIEALESAVAANTAAISSEATARENADKVITDTIGEVAEGKTVVGMISDALAEAKKYADDNDSVYDDTELVGRVKAIEDDYLKTADKYDDTQVKADIKAVADRVTPIEVAIGDETSGIIKNIADNAKAISDEVTARGEAIEQVLEDANAYTDEQITGLDVVIEKKENVDYIIIKNKNNKEIASVDASAFVKDSFLENVVYEPTTGDITFSFIDNSDNKSDIVINVKDLVDTYTAGNGLVVENNQFAIDTSIVATQSDLKSLSDVVDTKRTETEVDAQIDAKITAANLGQYAKTSDVESALANKVDTSTLETHVATYEEFVGNYTVDKETFATKTDLENKVDTTAYASDMAKVAKTADVNSQFTAVGQRIDKVVQDVETNAATVTETLKDYAKTSEVETTLGNYYTKTEVYTKGETDNKIDAKIASVTGGESAADIKASLESYRDAINQEIWGADATGWTTTVEEGDKTKVVYEPNYGKVSRIDTLENKVGQLESTDKAHTKSINDNTAAITTLNTSVNNLQTGLDTVSNSFNTLDNKVTNDLSPKVSSLDTTINGDDGLVSTVAGHTTKITSLESKDAELTGKIQANTNKFADYYTKTEVDGIVDTLEEAIDNVDLSSRVSVSDFEAYQTTVSNSLNEKAVASEVAASFETVNTEVAKKADKDSVYDKTTADATFVKSADFESLVDARVNALIDGANSADTITNVTNLIAFVNDNAGDIAQLVTDVQANSTTIAEHTATLEANDTAIKANAAAITALTTAVNNGIAGVTVHESTEVSVTARTGEGQTGIELGIKEVNVNKLVQTEGDVLILNGGNATN